MIEKNDAFKAGLIKAIRHRRKYLGWTTTMLAAVVGVGNSTVMKWEAGIALPNVAALPAVADALGLTTVEFVRIACKLGGCQ